MNQMHKNRHIDDQLIEELASNYISKIEQSFVESSQQRIDNVQLNLQKVLRSFRKEKLGSHHFASLTGYGHGDQGRYVIDEIFAHIFCCEKAAVRMQFVSGTHAISSALYGVLRPGDNLLSVTGKPYDTLEEVIGIRGSGQGSLKEFGVNYIELPLTKEGEVDFLSLETALDKPIKMAFIQRSRGYSWRPSLSINDIQKICTFIHNKQPDCVCFVDNCYGEFVEEREPIEVGADLIAGSLIKNLGGTIVPTGGYVAGKKKLVEKACCRLTSPGIGSQGGIGFDLNRLVLQGLFLAPQMVSEALIGADIIAAVFETLGFEVLPKSKEYRSDLIQAIKIGDPAALKLICKAFQYSSPVGSYLDPIPSSMPGYESNLIMAGGTFVDGSTSEFSADAPLRPPYILYVQGGTHRVHIKIALIHALSDLFRGGFIEL